MYIMQLLSISGNVSVVRTKIKLFKVIVRKCLFGQFNENLTGGQADLIADFRVLTINHLL